MVVLACLWPGRRYGLEILRSLDASSSLALTEGTLYPLLTRLKRDGLLSSEWVETTAGHPRKYYSLTPLGKDRLRGMVATWSEFSQSVDHLLEPLFRNNLEKAS